MIRRSITALLLAVAVPTAVVSTTDVQAQSRCNSFNYGIGSCVNDGPFRSPNHNQPGFGSGSNPYGGGYRPMLLEQPRFQPSFPSGYYGSPRYGW